METGGLGRETGQNAVNHIFRIAAGPARPKQPGPAFDQFLTSI
jgi:hypothetical protein